MSVFWGVRIRFFRRDGHVMTPPTHLRSCAKSRHATCGFFNGGLKREVKGRAVRGGGLSWTRLRNTALGVFNPAEKKARAGREALPRTDKTAAGKRMRTMHTSHCSRHHRCGGRALAVVLSLSLVVGIAPVSALAAEGEVTPEAAELTDQAAAQVALAEDETPATENVSGGGGAQRL